MELSCSADYLTNAKVIKFSFLTISIITRAELYYGALNKNELNRIQKHLDLLQNIPIDRSISEQFIQLMAQYSLSHKLTIPDAMIAATALTHNISLYTLNLKDFRFIQGLKIYQSPFHDPNRSSGVTDSAHRTIQKRLAAKNVCVN